MLDACVYMSYSGNVTILTYFRELLSDWLPIVYSFIYTRGV